MNSQLLTLGYPKEAVHYFHDELRIPVETNYTKARSKAEVRESIEEGYLVIGSDSNRFYAIAPEVMTHNKFKLLGVDLEKDKKIVLTSNIPTVMRKAFGRLNWYTATKRNTFDLDAKYKDDRFEHSAPDFLQQIEDIYADKIKLLANEKRKIIRKKIIKIVDTHKSTENLNSLKIKLDRMTSIKNKGIIALNDNIGHDTDNVKHRFVKNVLKTHIYSYYHLEEKFLEFINNDTLALQKYAKFLLSEVDRFSK